jgi:hypothetical protein
VFKNGAKAASKKSRRKSKIPESYFCNTLWYKSYKSLWSTIETKIQVIIGQYVLVVNEPCTF